MGIPTNPNQTGTDFSRDGVIKPPQIEWVKNDPKTTKHLPCADSSWLQSISYDSKSQRMTVTTKSGSSWQHAQVDEDQFTELQLHPSKGSYYSKNIKGNHPTTTILKQPKPANYPHTTKEPTNAKPKNRFPTSIYDNAVRYKTKGRYA